MNIGICYLTLKKTFCGGKLAKKEAPSDSPRRKKPPPTPPEGGGPYRAVSGLALQHVGISRRDGAGNRLPVCGAAFRGNHPTTEQGCCGRLPGRYAKWRNRHTGASLPFFYVLNGGLGHTGARGQGCLAQQASVHRHGVL